MPSAVIHPGHPFLQYMSQSKCRALDHDNERVQLIMPPSLKSLNMKDMQPLKRSYLDYELRLRDCNASVIPAKKLTHLCLISSIDGLTFIDKSPCGTCQHQENIPVGIFDRNVAEMDSMFSSIE